MTELLIGIVRDCVATNVTGFTIAEGIPANIGPSGLFYSLAYELMDEPHYISNVFDENKSALRCVSSIYGPRQSQMSAYTCSLTFFQLW